MNKMLLDILQGRVLVTPLRDLSAETLPRVKVRDGKPAIYTNVFVEQGSFIGNNSFLIACVIGDKVRIGEGCQIHGSHIGNGIHIGNTHGYTTISEETVLGDNAYLDQVRVGPRCRFGQNTETGNSSYGGGCVFGDNTVIRHWNRFESSCEFGSGTVIETSNVFYGHPKFASKPELNERPHIQDKSLQIFQTTELDQRDNRGRKVVLLSDYLERDPVIWLKRA